MNEVWTYYADDRTCEAIGDGRECVLLVGSYMGYPNFGDILQLKGALRAHTARSNCRPVLILDIDSISDDGFTERVRRQIGIEALVFTSWTGVTGAPAGLREVALPPIPRLHLYGGGFLNRLWGDYVLSLVEHVHERFGVSRYAISGQQVDPRFAARVTEHVKRCSPVIAGGRDLMSTDVLRECGAHALYSFDDAAEIIRGLAGALCTRDASDESGAPADKAAPPHVLVHLNASGYTREGEESAQAEMLLSHLTRLLEHAGDDAQVTLLQAYTDRRAADIVDTLGVVQLLEDRSPLRRYQVLHLDRAALDVDVEGAASLRALTPRPTVAMASSYHVSMLCAAMGVPCWMESRNEYYDQKRVGLGYTDESFETFLEAPSTRDLGSAFEARERWLSQLARAWEGDAEPSTRERRAEGATPPREWFSKRSAPALRAALDARRREADERSLRVLQYSDERHAAASAELAGARAALANLESRLIASESLREETARQLGASQEAHAHALTHVAAVEASLAEAQRVGEALRHELSQTQQRLAETAANLEALREHSTRTQNALRHDGDALRANVRHLSERLATTGARLEMLQALCERTKSRLSRIIA